MANRPLPAAGCLTYLAGGGDFAFRAASVLVVALSFSKQIGDISTPRIYLSWYEGVITNEEFQAIFPSISVTWLFRHLCRFRPGVPGRLCAEQVGHVPSARTIEALLLSPFILRY